MRHFDLKYEERLPEEFSIHHKITKTTEKQNFHMHKQMEIIFALSDNLKCYYENGVIDIPKNGIILFHPMNLHYIFSEKGSGICDRLVLYFSSSYISRLSTPEINLLDCFFSASWAHPSVLSVPESQIQDFLFLLQKMEAYQNMDQNATYGLSLHIQFLLGQFLLLTNELYSKKFQSRRRTALQNHSRMVFDICDHIHKHYDQELHMEDLSRTFLISKTQLYYLFKEVLGTTTNEYIAEYRIARAKDLLLNSPQSVEFISQMVGYSTLSSFSRAFKNRTGCSPFQYRRQYLARDSHRESEKLGRDEQPPV